MTSELEYTINNDRYNVVSVEKTEPPQGVTDGTWFRYIIGHGTSKIEGMKPGSLATVTQHAHTVADDLNERASRGGSFYAPRQRK